MRRLLQIIQKHKQTRDANEIAALVLIRDHAYYDDTNLFGKKPLELGFERWRRDAS